MTPAWTPTQKFGETKQPFVSFASSESNGLNRILLKGEGGQLEDKLYHLQKLSTPFQKCSQSYLNLSVSC